MKKLIKLVLALATTFSLVACNSTTEEVEEVVEIEFFEYKQEAIDIFEVLAAEFMAEHPNIKVTVSSPPESGTVIKTRVSSGDIPDIIAVGADQTYKDLAEAGVYVDLSNDPALDLVHEAYIQTIKDVSQLDEVYGIPYIANANAIIYNKAIFAENGVEVPTTWEELMAAAETFKAAGVTPFYFTFKDAWTTLPAWNVIAANTAGNQYFIDYQAGVTTSSENYRESLEKLKDLVQYGHDDNMGKTYPDGNTAFALGESAMYLQGIWAITDILKANPDIEVGIFPYPVGDSTVISGVDLLFSVADASEHKEEAMLFVNFLLEQENSTRFINDQKLFSAVKGVEQTAEELNGVSEAFAAGNVADFPDHYVPSSVDLASVLQQFVLDQDVDATLQQLTDAYDAFLARQ